MLAWKTEEAAVAMAAIQNAIQACEEVLITNKCLAVMYTFIIDVFCRRGNVWYANSGHI